MVARACRLLVTAGRPALTIVANERLTVFYALSPLLAPDIH
jgi:hypothetical protein